MDVDKNGYWIRLMSSSNPEGRLRLRSEGVKWCIFWVSSVKKKWRWGVKYIEKNNEICMDVDNQTKMDRCMDSGVDWTLKEG